MPQSKAPFLTGGGPAGPSNAQENNQSVLDRPRHGSGPSEPRKTATVRPIDQNDPSAELERRHKARTKVAPHADTQPGNVSSEE